MILLRNLSLFSFFSPEFINLLCVQIVYAELEAFTRYQITSWKQTLNEDSN